MSNHLDHVGHSLSKWLMGAPLLVAMVIFAAAVVHAAYGTPWSGILPALALTLTFQLGWYVAMFWVRQRYLVTRDLRLATLVSGGYIFGVVLTIDHYLWKWNIFTKSRFNEDALQILIYTAIAIGILSIWQARSSGISRK